MARCIWYYGTVAIGGLELTGGEDDPEEDYVEEEIFRCFAEHYRRVREKDHIQGTQPKRGDKDPRAVAHFEHDGTIFKSIMQLIYVGEPYDGDELSDETLAKWVKAITAGTAELVEDLPVRVLVNLLCFLELQGVDQHGVRHNLQAMYLVDKAKACGPDNTIAQAAIGIADRSSAQGRRLAKKRFGVGNIARRTALVARTTATASFARVAHAFSTEAAEAVPYSDYYGGYARGDKSVRVPSMTDESETGVWEILFTTRECFF